MLEGKPLYFQSLNSLSHLSGGVFCEVTDSARGRPILRSETDPLSFSVYTCNTTLRETSPSRLIDQVQTPNLTIPPPNTSFTPPPVNRTKVVSPPSEYSEYSSPTRFEKLFPLNSSLADEFARLFAIPSASPDLDNEVSPIDEFRKIGKESEYFPDAKTSEDGIIDANKKIYNAISPFARPILKAKKGKPEPKFKFICTCKPIRLLFGEIKTVYPAYTTSQSYKTSWRECVFCKNNGEEETMYKSHILKDKFNKVQCPVLRKYVCPHCGESGDKAHTKKYCDKKKKIGVEDFQSNHEVLIKGIEKLSV
ncbi:hypothetical protein QYM36_003375 [Artemia franciscana]|uniref:Nanos-type domain-containing protein n=1 Tax=Artemia franciscana TaxID=6661 RepID=A0AA88IBB9_ARTSF|nr:hypothetical protein QYM36_003375 [Artemia franciscana]